MKEVSRKLFQWQQSPVLNWSGRLRKKLIPRPVCVFAWLAISIAIARMLKPTLLVDTITLWLIGIAAAIFLFEDVKPYLHSINKLKLGPTGLEIEREIKRLEENTVEATKDASQSSDALISGSGSGSGSGSPSPSSSYPYNSGSGGNKDLYFPPIDVSQEIKCVLEIASSQPKAALLWLSSQIETTMRNRLRSQSLSSASARQMLETGIRYQIFSPAIYAAFNDFWRIRNLVVHGQSDGITDDQILRIIDTGTDILKIIAGTIPQSGSGSGSGYGSGSGSSSSYSSGGG